MTLGHTQAWRGNYSLWSSILSREWFGRGGGIGSLLHKVFSYKIPGERPAGFRHIGGGAGNTAEVKQREFFFPPNRDVTGSVRSVVPEMTSSP